MDRKLLANIFASAGLTLITISLFGHFSQNTGTTGAPPGGVEESEVPENLSVFDIVKNWVRPEGPPRVGLQVGHWKRDEVPEELERLKANTGASGGGKSEWEINYSIAIEMKKILENQNIVVDILPTTVPPKYWADVFIAIHADGNTDPSVSGFKFAGPWRDFTGGSELLVDLLEKSYGDETSMVRDENISRNMRGYYAFSWWKYEHAVHPMTTSVIAETGFLTNRSDRALLIDSPQIPAQAMSNGIVKYLQQKQLL